MHVRKRLCNCKGKVKILKTAVHRTGPASARKGGKPKGQCQAMCDSQSESLSLAHSASQWKRKLRSKRRRKREGEMGWYTMWIYCIYTRTPWRPLVWSEWLGHWATSWGSCSSRIVKSYIICARGTHTPTRTQILRGESLHKKPNEKEKLTWVVRTFLCRIIAFRCAANITALVSVKSVWQLSGYKGLILSVAYGNFAMRRGQRQRRFSRNKIIALRADFNPPQQLTKTTLVTKRRESASETWMALKNDRCARRMQGAVLHWRTVRTRTFSNGQAVGKRTC